MTTILSSPMHLTKIHGRSSTPGRRRSLAPLQCNLMTMNNIQRVLLDFIDSIKDSPDSSTQLLIRLYNHKSLRLNDQPEKLYSFQREIYDALRRLHPAMQTLSTFDQENTLITLSKPIVSGRSGHATIRRLH